METTDKTTATIQVTCNGKGYELDVTAWAEDYGTDFGLDYKFDIDAIWQGDNCLQGSEIYKEIESELDAENVFHDAWNARRQVEINLHKSLLFNKNETV